MTEQPESRRYRKRKRAAQEEETRRRITEAAVELHRTVGPAKTTVTDVARLAGVSRMTVYNHFPAEYDLIDACSSHWAAQNPPPDPEAWRSMEDPVGRLAAALTELYTWYGSTEDMMGNVLRDVSIVEPLDDIMRARWQPYLDRAVRVLAEKWPRAGDGLTLRSALRVCVDFETWRLLRDSGVRGEDAVILAVRMVEGAAEAKVDESRTRPDRGRSGG